MCRKMELLGSVMMALGAGLLLSLLFSSEFVLVVLGIALSVGLFALLPTFLAGLLNRLVPLGVWRGLAEGIFRLAIFL